MSSKALRKPLSNRSNPLALDNVQTIEYGTQTISFNLSYSERTTLEIAVYPDQTVWVTAPNGSSNTKIYEKVKKRRRWIVKQIKYFGRFEKNNTQFEYVSGETHRYLGKQYRLKVIQTKNVEKESVKLKNGYFFIHTHDKDNANHVKRLLEQWYRAKAEDKFDRRLQLCLEMASKYGLQAPKELSVYAMEKRWGSYTASGKILLNPELIKHPTYCIDYVIIHELCHTQFPNHDKNFYRLLGKVLPDWQNRKHKLEGFR